MDMRDLLDSIQREIAENDPERQKPPMDHVLSFSGPLGGGFAGPSEGGFGMRLDDREEPPHVWAVTRRRVALSLEPWLVDVLEVDDDSRPGEGTGARVVAEHVLHPRVEAYVIEGTIAGERHVVYATITPQRYRREPLRQMANQLVLTPREPMLRDPYEASPYAGCGLAMVMRAEARSVWAWRMPRELDAPQEVRLVVVDGQGIPDQAMIDASPVLATAHIAPSSAQGDAPRELHATHEGATYRLEVTWKSSARRARELLETDPYLDPDDDGDAGSSP